MAETASKILPDLQVLRMPITYQGRVWPSYAALGRRYWLAPDVVKYRLAKGWPLEVRRIRCHVPGGRR